MTTIKTPVQHLLDFIISKELQLEQYPSLIDELKKYFNVFAKVVTTDSITGHKQLIDTIIRWEKGEQQASLEETIRSLFDISLTQEFVLPNLNKTEAVPSDKEFQAIVRPLIKWLNDNYHPHVTVIVTPTNAELVEGLKSTGPIMDYVKD